MANLESELFAQIDRIRLSRLFAKAIRQVELLSYLLKWALDSPDDPPTEIIIGWEFKVDPIVKTIFHVQ